MKVKPGKILLSEEEIHSKVKELAAKIREDYRGKQLVCICILKGAAVFFVDLMKEIGPEVDVRMDFLRASSYGSAMRTSGNVHIFSEIGTDICGKEVLVVEDIIDTGISLDYLKDLLIRRNPASFNICVLLDKVERRQKPVDIKYVGYVIPDAFVIGYGLDVDNEFRHLKDIHVAEVVEL